MANDFYPPEDPAPEDLATRRGLATIPNAICAGRFVGSLVLPALAYAQQDIAFLVLALLLSFSDWIDGKLAIALNQRSVYGARLDSVADFTMYFCMLWGLTVLRGPQLWAERWWLLAALGSYAITFLFALWKYGKPPAYHTRGAKTSWFFATVAVIALIIYRHAQLLRLAAALVVLTNIETIAMTALLRRWHVDVMTFREAWDLRKIERGDKGDVEVPS